jgi:hypothetical protein
MSLIKRLQSYFSEEPSAQDVVRQLQESLEQFSDRLLEYCGARENSIHSHVHAASRSMNEALCALETDTERKALQTARAGLVHLHLARMLATGKDFDKVEMRAPSDTIEGALYELTDRLAKVKLLVEYGELTIDPSIQESLLDVMKIFDAAVSDFRKRHTADARRAVNAAEVALHAVVCNVEVSNQHGNLASLKVARETASPAQWKACELASKIAECRRTLNALQKGGLPEAVEHLTAAEEKFESCLDNLTVGDDTATALEARAGLLEVQTANRLANDAEFGGERRKDSHVRATISQFQQDLRRIVRLTESLSVDTAAMERRLEDSARNFLKAHKCLGNDELAESEVSARAAHLDLDFAWQLANCSHSAKYREEI